MLAQLTEVFACVLCPHQSSENRHLHSPSRRPPCCAAIQGRQWRTRIDGAAHVQSGFGGQRARWVRAPREGRLIAEVDATTQSNAVRTAAVELRSVRAQRGASLREVDLHFLRQRAHSAVDVVSRADHESAEAAVAAQPGDVSNRAIMEAIGLATRACPDRPSRRFRLACSTLSGRLARLVLSRLSRLEPRASAVRYERAGKLLHIEHTAAKAPAVAGFTCHGDHAEHLAMLAGTATL